MNGLILFWNNEIIPKITVIINILQKRPTPQLGILDE